MRFLVVLLAMTIAAASHAESASPAAVAAADALRTGDFTVVAIWVKPAQERTLQLAFRRVLVVRVLGPDAREVADAYFVEVTLRLHRHAGDAPRRAAEAALAHDNPDRYIELVTTAVQRGLRDRWERMTALRSYRRGDLEAGRRYVAAYVDAVRYAIDVYAAASVAQDRSEEAIRHED